MRLIAWRRRILVLALAFGGIPVSALSQSSIQPNLRRGSKEAAVPRVNLRVDTSLVLVPVTVNDGLNHPVTGSQKENFLVYDDKVQQTIATFSNEDEPIALGLVFDTSGSMSGTLRQGRREASSTLWRNTDKKYWISVDFPA